MNLKKMMQGLVFFLTSLLVFVFLFRALLPSASPRMTKPKTAEKEITYRYVALGDSLTKGVGDSTNQGGFVPILAQSLSNENDGQYQPVNYGVGWKYECSDFRSTQEANRPSEGSQKGACHDLNGWRK